MNEYLNIYKEIITKRYAQFSGRASRKEYWSFTLINTAIYCILFALFLILIEVSKENETLIGVLGLVSFILILFFLAIFLPSLAISIRRLHDIGKSGFYFFVNLIPIVGPIILLIFMITPGQSIINQWGPNPYENKFYL